jgi:hypothetical protein
LHGLRRGDPVGLVVRLKYPVLGGGIAAERGPGLSQQIAKRVRHGRVERRHEVVAAFVGHSGKGARARASRRRNGAEQSGCPLSETKGRYADAEPLYQRSLAIREKALGREHPDVAPTLNNLL